MISPNNNASTTVKPYSCNLRLSHTAGECDTINNKDKDYQTTHYEDDHHSSYFPPMLCHKRNKEQGDNHNHNNKNKVLAWILVLTLLVACHRIGNTSRSVLHDVTSMVETRSLSLAPIPDHHDNDGKYPIANIALLGQFNYDVPAHRVENWVQIWSRYFSTVSVVGPFSEQTHLALQQAGVDAYVGEDDKGFVSPIQNVVDALERAPSEIEAVLYVHDDGLLNLTKFFQGQPQIPTDKFIGNLQHVPDRSYSITIPTKTTTTSSSSSPSHYHHDQVPRNTRIKEKKKSNHNKIIYDIPSHNSAPTSDRKQFLQSLPKWKWKEQCLQQQLNMLTRPNSPVQEFSANYYHHNQDYANDHDDSQEEDREQMTSLQYFFASNGQMDFLLIPTVHKDLFVRIAQFFIQDRVFLECAFPTIVLWVLQEAKRRRLHPTRTSTSSTVIEKNADNQDLHHHHAINHYDDASSERSLTAKQQDYVAYPEVLAQETTYLPVCTSWNKRKRGTPQVLEECLDDPIEYGMYHPVKLSSYSAVEYMQWLDCLQKPHCSRTQ